MISVNSGLTALVAAFLAVSPNSMEMYRRQTYKLLVYHQLNYLQFILPSTVEVSRSYTMGSIPVPVPPEDARRTSPTQGQGAP
jgi:hypothetical protein